jgi:uncharacterized protein YndB with AHSA1/START domain
MARTDTASRVIAASLDRVFAALVDPEALTAWLPPDGMGGRFERFDARPGGSYRLVLTYADASSARGKATADSDIVEARFVGVVPGVWVVQGVDFVSDDPTHAGTMTMTWEVTAVDAGTRVDIRAATSPSASPRRITLPDSPLHSPTSPPTSSSNRSGHDRGAGLGTRRWPQRSGSRKAARRDADAFDKERS